MDESTGYVWEAEYERTWEALCEDERGSLQPSIDAIIEGSKRRRILKTKPNVRLGMMRHVILILDMSQSMLDVDLKPNRFLCSLKMLELFISEFFDQNPIGQLAILSMKKKRCEKITDLGSNSRVHIEALHKLKMAVCEGEVSLYNSLNVAQTFFSNVPSHINKEIIVIFGSLSTIDPQDIFSLIKNIKSNNIHCSIIGLSAALHVCQEITRSTQGKYSVILDDIHFKSALNEHLLPPVSSTNQESSIVRMGFPELETSSSKKFSLCMCHLECQDIGPFIGKMGYICPQCSSKYCTLPTECIVCGLALVSTPHLARAYHHLFPVPSFSEVSVDTLFKKDKFCEACLTSFTGRLFSRCVDCGGNFCSDCDIFIHETLHSCPSCSSVHNKLTTF